MTSKKCIEEREVVVSSRENKTLIESGINAIFLERERTTRFQSRQICSVVIEGDAREIIFETQCVVKPSSERETLRAV